MPPNRSFNRRNDRGSLDVSDVLGSGASKLKKKIRDIERVLKREDLPGKVRNDNERALQGLKTELENAQFNLKSRKNAKKYHMVRFFEKKKAIRRLKQAQKNYEEASKTEVRKDIKKARIALKHCEVDVIYVVTFPMHEKYISLYPKAKCDEEEEEEVELDEKTKRGLLETDQRRIELKKEVETKMSNGTFSFTIDDVLKGRHIRVHQRSSANVPEPDAPTQTFEGGRDSEDEFFE